MLNGFGQAEEIESLRDNLARRYGVEVRYHAADLARPGEIADLLQASREAFGRADILVNNAGIQHTALIEDFPQEKWDAVLAINLSAAFHAMKAAIPDMKQAGWGRIVNIASAHALVGSAQKSAYVAAKHGMVGLTKVAAIELAQSGITCNAICPGWVLTPLVSAQIEARALREGKTTQEVEGQMLAEKQPMHRFTTPAQIGAMVVFLCSEAAASITGAPLSIDGGWVAT